MKRKAKCSYVINWEQEFELNESNNEKFELEIKDFIMHCFTGVKCEAEEAIGDDEFSVSVNINWEKIGDDSR